MGEAVFLEASIRQKTGKEVSRKLRQQGQIPGVLYGLGKNTPLVLNPRPVERLLLREGARRIVLTLKGEGLEGRHALIKDFQVHPVTDRLYHVDLLEVDLTKKVEVSVPIHFVGKAKGIVAGGVLNVIQRELEVRCQADRIPESIDVDVSELEIGDSIHVEDVKLPEGVEAVEGAGVTLVTVVPPEQEEAASTQAEEGAEPEVITQKKEEKKQEDKKDKK